MKVSRMNKNYLLPALIASFIVKVAKDCLSSVSCIRYALFVLIFILATREVKAQLPANVLVGYHENWNTELLSQAHANYNVINLAFALPKTTGPTGACRCDIIYTRPPGYASDAAFMAEIDALHALGKKVILSLGGATGPIYLGNATDRTTFINSVNAIFTQYSNKIDGIDLDLEGSSMSSISSALWTMAAPQPGQTNMVTAVQSIMATYLANTGKKMILTMAPEVYYCTGALAPGQIGFSGGIFLPILDGLRNELDLLMMQLYNAPGGMVAWDNIIYYEGTPEFSLALNETMIKGFACLNSKGNFVGLPASKIALGYPATPNASTAGSGFLSFANICNVSKYFKGTIAKPGAWTYTMTASYPTLRGLMTWDIWEDKYVNATSYNFATNYLCAFPATAPVSLISFEGKRLDQTVTLNWTTANEQNNDYFNVERSFDGKTFTVVDQIKGSGTSSDLVNYSYKELNVHLGISYYRLVQFDFDGTLTYSDIISVGAIQNENGLLLAGNPFSEEVKFSTFGIQEGTEAAISISDCSGKFISSISISKNQEYTISETLSAGIYIMVYEYNGEIKRYKVVKK